MAANPNTGKTHGRYLRMLINGYNLSGDMRSVNAFGTELDQDDATGWSDDVMQYMAGRGRVLLDGFTAIFNNEAAGTGPTLAWLDSEEATSRDAPGWENLVGRL